MNANESPIYFNTPMIRALLDGRKTQTRRIVKEQNLHSATWSYNPDKNILVHRNGSTTEGCPFGGPGDKLWVRETATPNYLKDGYAPSKTSWKSLPLECRTPEYVIYRADMIDPTIYKWNASIHMPRWASRINLEIKAVRVEKLQSISHDDVLAEGFKCCTKDGLLAKHGLEEWAWQDYEKDPQVAFSKVWNQVYPGTWNLNPWVWVIEFERVA